MAKRKKNDWNPSKSAAENAKLLLPRLAAVYFGAGRRITVKPLPPAKLHPFRLRTKRFRYTLELFRPCYGRGLGQRLDALRRIQQYLGDISDCTATRALLGAAAGVQTRSGTSLSRFLNQRAAARAAEFRRYWTRTFDAFGREGWWTGYLVRFAGRVSKAKRK